MLVYGAGAAFLAWSRPNLVGAGVGSGTSDFRSRSRQKKWRLRNTDCESSYLGYFLVHVLSGQFTHLKLGPNLEFLSI